MSRVVLIEDEARLLRTLRSFLESAGHEVRAVERFSEVEADLWPGTFEVLVTDIVMPGSTGVEILRRLVERGCREPVILITGEPNVETATEALRLGAYDYLAKPLMKPMLVSVVGRALHHVGMMRQLEQAKLSQAVMLERLASFARTTTGLSEDLREAPAGAIDESRRLEWADRLESLSVELGATMEIVRPISIDAQPLELAGILAGIERIVPGDRVSLHVQSEESGGPILGDGDLLLEMLRLLVEDALDRGAHTLRLHTRGPADQPCIELEHDADPDGPAQQDAALRLARARLIASAHGGAIDQRQLVTGRTQVRVRLSGATR